MSAMCIYKIKLCPYNKCIFKSKAYAQSQIFRHVLGNPVIKVNKQYNQGFQGKKKKVKNDQVDKTFLQVNNY